MGAGRFFTAEGGAAGNFGRVGDSAEIQELSVGCHVKPRSRLFNEWAARVATIKNFFGAAMSQLRQTKPFVKEPDRREFSTMSLSSRKAMFRMIAASFLAGACAMAMVGLVGPVMFGAGLSMREAMAATVAARAPLIEPIDVAAVEAQLAEADRAMAMARVETDGMVSRLSQLSRL